MEARDAGAKRAAVKRCGQCGQRFDDETPKRNRRFCRTCSHERRLQANRDWVRLHRAGGALRRCAWCERRVTRLRDDGMCTQQCAEHKRAWDERQRTAAARRAPGGGVPWVERLYGQVSAI
jgi:hypothetical protein